MGGIVPTVTKQVSSKRTVRFEENDGPEWLPARPKKIFATAKNDKIPLFVKISPNCPGECEKCRISPKIPVENAFRKLQ